MPGCPAGKIWKWILKGTFGFIVKGEILYLIVLFILLPNFSQSFFKCTEKWHPGFCFVFCFLRQLLTQLGGRIWWKGLSVEVALWGQSVYMVICQQMELPSNKYCDVLSQRFRQSDDTGKTAFTAKDTFCIYFCWRPCSTMTGWINHGINGQNQVNLRSCRRCGYFRDFTAQATPGLTFLCLSVTKYNTVSWNNKTSHSHEIL